MRRPGARAALGLLAAEVAERQVLDLVDVGVDAPVRRCTVPPLGADRSPCGGARPRASAATIPGTPRRARRTGRRRSSARPRRRPRRGPRARAPPSTATSSRPPRSRGVPEVDVAGTAERRQPQPDARHLERGSSEHDQLHGRTPRVPGRSHGRDTTLVPNMRLSSLRHFTRDPLLAEAAMTEDQREPPGHRRDPAPPRRGLHARRADRRSADRAGDRGRRDARGRLGRDGGRDRAAGSDRRIRRGPRRFGRRVQRRLPARRTGDVSDRPCIPTVLATRASSASASNAGRPVFDLDYVIGEVWRTQRPLRIDLIEASTIKLHCTATDVDRAEIVDLAELRDGEEIRCAMRASARLPWLAGPPVHFRGRRCSTPPWPRRSRCTRARHGRPTCWCCRPGRTASSTRRCRAGSHASPIATWRS